MSLKNWHKSGFFWLIATNIGLLAVKNMPSIVENYYIPYFFIILRNVFSFLLGWLPFSVGDIFYLLLIAYLIVRIFRFFKNRTFAKLKVNFKTYLFNGFKVALKVCLFFNLVWGIAYNRISFQKSISLDNAKINATEMKAFFGTVVDSLNELSEGLKTDPVIYTKRIFPELTKAYSAAAKKYPKLSYHSFAVKPSLFSKPLSYMGFHGYYNPVTTEAQINASIPDFFKPIVALHEMAHQLGFAQEDQANLIAFIAAEHSNNAAIKYAYYFDLMLYSRGALQLSDSTFVKEKFGQASAKLKHDIAQWRKYVTTHQSPAASLSAWFYNKFLQVNATSKGVSSYNDALGIIINWRKQVKYK